MFHPPKTKKDTHPKMSAKGPMSRVNFIKELFSHCLYYVTAELLPQLLTGGAAPSTNYPIPT